MEKGFTLVELLAVVALLSVILLVAIPNITNDNKEAKEQECLEYKKNIENAAEVYVETGDYSNLKNNNNIAATISVTDLISAGLLKSNLKNPSGSPASGSVTAKNNGGMIEYTYNGSC